MKAQYSRLRVQNRPVSRRAARQEKPIVKPVRKPVAKITAKPVTKSPAKGSERITRRRRSSGTAREHDSRVFWLIVLFGALLTAGFLLGLRSQINAHQLNQAEEKLRDELDRYASEQKFLNLDQKRALSPRESERSVKEAGLLQVRLDEKNALAQLPAQLLVKSPIKLDPSKTSNSSPFLAVNKSAGRAVAVKPSFDKLPTTRRGADLKTPKTVDKKAAKSKSLVGKQSDLSSSKHKTIKTPKALTTGSPKAKRDGSGHRQIARTSERR